MCISGIIYHMSQHFRGESETFGGEISPLNSSEINTVGLMGSYTIGPLL